MRLLSAAWDEMDEHGRVLPAAQPRRRHPAGRAAARLQRHSVDFGPVVAMQHDWDWARTAAVLVEAAQSLERAGADSLLVATNTMRKVADEIEAATGIPLLHSADATARCLLAVRAGEKVALLATAFTMEQEYYKLRSGRPHWWAVATGVRPVIPRRTQRRLTRPGGTTSIRTVSAKLSEERLLGRHRWLCRSIIPCPRDIRSVRDVAACTQ